MQTNEDYYFNEEGLLVFTEAYHIKRGYCCGNKCRHCPYEYENVPESRLNKTTVNQAKNSGNEDK